MGPVRRVPVLGALFVAQLIAGACTVGPPGTPDGGAAITEAGYRAAVATLASDASRAEAGHLARARQGTRAPTRRPE